MPLDIVIKLYLGLLTSLPAIVFFTGFGSLLSLQGRMGHVLTFVITIPLIIPAIILGAGIVYTHEPLNSVIQLPIIFSLISILITVPASGYLYKQVYYC
jgi:ABC-type transport system involved in cytochrome c biogenesis permease component